MADLSCPACHDPVSMGDHFCETCGAALSFVDDPATADTALSGAGGGGGVGRHPVGACVDCGAGADRIDADGYCERCGRRQPPPREHAEIELVSLAGVTDQGLVHTHNEDAMALAEPDLAPGAFAVVVCDGVSSSQLADQAARVAADTALVTLCDALADPAADLEAASTDAVRVAQAAVSALAWDRTDKLDPPSCTFVSAARRPGGPIVSASVGDTRAYWFSSGQGVRLAADDSWAAEQIAHGTDPSTAEADPRAHAITRWLGADAPEPRPHLFCVEVDGPGRLLVCSDGLWNYASTVEQLAPMVTGGTPLDAAQKMTSYALDRGGHDNITVVVVAVEATTNTKESS